VILALVLAAIAGCGLVVGLLQNRAIVAQANQYYRWTIKFEDGPVTEEAFPYRVSTHINIYNPNPFPVGLTKQFVRTLSERESEMTDFDGRTVRVPFDVPPGEGFEIDREDIVTWDQDPENPIDITLPWPPSPDILLKGFVIIECQHNLTVVAIYNKLARGTGNFQGQGTSTFDGSIDLDGDSWFHGFIDLDGDSAFDGWSFSNIAGNIAFDKEVLNKITFHLKSPPIPTELPPVPPDYPEEYKPIKQPPLPLLPCNTSMKPDTPYELILPAPSQGTPIDIEKWIKDNLGIPSCYNITILAVDAYFDMLECIPKNKILFSIGQPRMSLEDLMRLFRMLNPIRGPDNKILPPPTPPQWLQLGKKLEIVIEIEQHRFRNVEEVLRNELKSRLLDEGWNDTDAENFIKNIVVEIQDVDVAAVIQNGNIVLLENGIFGGTDTFNAWGTFWGADTFNAWGTIEGTDGIHFQGTIDAGLAISVDIEYIQPQIIQVP